MDTYPIIKQCIHECTVTGSLCATNSDIVSLHPALCLLCSLRRTVVVMHYGMGAMSSPGPRVDHETRAIAPLVSLGRRAGCHGTGAVLSTGRSWLRIRAALDAP